MKKRKEKTLNLEDLLDLEFNKNMKLLFGICPIEILSLLLLEKKKKNKIK